MPDNQGQQIQPGSIPYNPLSVHEDYSTLYDILYPQQSLYPQAIVASPEPIAYEAPRLNFQVGDIYSWNMNLEEVRRYIKAIGMLGRSIVKIEKISGGNIDSISWLEDAHGYTANISFESFNKYLIPATEEEKQRFNDAYNELNLLTEMPLPGTVVVYKGEESILYKAKAVVLSHSINDKIFIEFQTGEYRREALIIDFKVCSISKKQETGFPFEPKRYCRCESCNSLRPVVARLPNEEGRVLTINGHNFCDSNCAEEAGYINCVDCCTWHTGLLNSAWQRDNICNSCFRNYMACSDCGNRMHIRNLLVLTNTRCLCSDCLTSKGSQLHSYSYKPTPIYSKMAWENTRYLGIELEVECQGNRENLSNSINTYLKELTDPKGKPLHKLTYYKTDGSLHNGIEIVLHPFTLQSFHKWFPAKKILEFLKENGAIIQSNCGMHVHVSKEKLSNEQLIRGKWFFYRCRPWLEKLSQREGNFDYCKFEDKSTNDPYEQQQGRRIAFNVAASPKTVELRLFKSTLDYSKFMTNLQFSDCFVDYIQHGAGGAFFRNTNGQLMWEHFIDYAKKNNQWNIMVSYLLKQSIV